jgi:Arm DNA-binding domain
MGLMVFGYWRFGPLTAGLCRAPEHAGVGSARRDRPVRARGFKTKRDAEAWANQLEVDKRRGAYVAPAAGRVKLGDYARDWLAAR